MAGGVGCGTSRPAMGWNARCYRQDRWPVQWCVSEGMEGEGLADARAERVKLSFFFGFHHS